MRLTVQSAAAGGVCVAIAGILWGVLGLFVRQLSGYDLMPLDVVGVRGDVASVFLLLWLLVTDRAALRIRLRDIWCFLGTGIGSIVFFNYCYFSAVEQMSLACAAVLLYTAPAFVMILSRLLFREPLTGPKLLSLVLTFAGCVLVTGVLSSQPNLTTAGVLLGLGSGLGYALYTIFGRYALQRGYTAKTITFYTFLIAGLVVGLGNGTERVAAAVLDPSALVWMLALGVCSTVLPFLLYTLGLTRLEGGRASIIASIEPVTAAVLGIVYYAEVPSLMTLAGMLLVLLGIVIACRS